MTPLTIIAEPIADAPAAEPEIDLRPMMAAFPTGVAVITAIAADGQPLGMTCSSLCSASLSPPLVLACLRRGSPTLAAIRRGRFTLNLLQSHATATARLFASGRADRFDHVRWTAGRGGPRLTDDAHTIADFSVVATYQAGDHDVVVGQALSIEELTPPEPLMYGLRRFLHWNAHHSQPSRDA